jgi:hypothetical protein
MSTCQRLASATLAAVMLPALQAESHCPGNDVSLRLRLVQRSQIIVPVTINHTGPYDFLVDTGSQITIIDPALAADLHLRTEGTTGFIGVGFSTRPSFAHLDSLEAGSQTAENTLVVLQNLDQLHATDPHIRGILGGNFLRHFDVLIDYAHRTLCLDAPQTMDKEIKGKHIEFATPHPAHQASSTEPLIIPVRLTGMPSDQLLLLDSGTNVPLLYHAAEIAGGFSVTTPIHDRGSDGTERVFTALPPQDIKIGTLAFHQVPFISLTSTSKVVPKVEVDGLLPTSLFRRVYISYAGRFVVLDPW